MFTEKGPMSLTTFMLALWASTLIPRGKSFNKWEDQLLILIVLKIQRTPQGVCFQLDQISDQFVSQALVKAVAQIEKKKKKNWKLSVVHIWAEQIETIRENREMYNQSKTST